VIDRDCHGEFSRLVSLPLLHEFRDLSVRLESKFSHVTYLQGERCQDAKGILPRISEQGRPDLRKSCGISSAPAAAARA
jgi:hypothetical protein